LAAAIAAAAGASSTPLSAGATAQTGAAVALASCTRRSENFWLGANVLGLDG